MNTATSSTPSGRSKKGKHETEAKAEEVETEVDKQLHVDLKAAKRAKLAALLSSHEPVDRTATSVPVANRSATGELPPMLLARMISAPEPTTIEGIKGKAAHQSVVLTSTLPDSPFTKTLCNGDRYVWSVPRVLKAANTGDDKKKKPEPRKLDANSRPVKLPPVTQMLFFFQKEFPSMSEYMRMFPAGTEVLLKDVHVEHLPNKNGEMAYYFKATPEVRRQGGLATGAPVPMFKLVSELLKSDAVHEDAAKFVMPLLGNGRQPSMLALTRNAANQAQTMHVEAWNEKQLAADRELESWICNSPAPPGVDLSSVQPVEAAGLAYAPLLLTPGVHESSLTPEASRLFLRMYVDGPADDQLPSVITELVTTQAPAIEGKCVTLHLTVQNLVLDRLGALEASRQTPPDMSGHLKASHASAVLGVKIRIDTLAAMFGIFKKSYLLAALNALCSNWSGLLAMHTSLSNRATPRQSLDHPIEKEFPMWGCGNQIDLPTMLVRGGVEVSMSFLLKHFSFEEGTKTPPEGGAVRGTSKWKKVTTASDDDVPPTVDGEKAPKVKELLFPTHGIANLRAYHGDLSDLADDSPYDDPTKAKSLALFVVYEKSSAISQALRHQVHMGDLEPTRTAKVSAGEEALLAAAAEAGTSVNALVANVKGSIYAVDNLLVEGATAAFGGVL